MMSIFFTLLFVSGMLAASNADQSQQCPGPKSKDKFPRKAVIHLVEAASSGVKGTLHITEYQDGLLIRGDITGLTPGKHGFHIHETGNTSKNCVAAGSHFNPVNSTHGSPKSKNRHVGDLGNILTPKTGPTKVLIFDEVITLDPKSKMNILDRAVVVHEKQDDLGQGGNGESLITGNAGKRVACGIIQFQCPVEFAKKSK